MSDRRPRIHGQQPERLLKACELGELLGLSTATVLDWHEAGRIPSFKLGPGPGGPVRFRVSEVEAWLEGCRRGPETLARREVFAHPLEVDRVEA